MRTPPDEFVIRERSDMDGAFVIEDEQFHELFRVVFEPPTDRTAHTVMVDPEALIKQIGALMLSSHADGRVEGQNEIRKAIRYLLGITQC